MTVLLGPGQSLDREAVVAVVDWSATGTPGRVSVVVETVAGLTKASWRELAPGKLVVNDLPSAVAVVAQPVGSALFDAGTTARLSVGLRSRSGVQEDVVVEGVDLSAGPEQVLLTLTPTPGGAWQVARPASRGDVDLPPGVREAFYAARKATGGATRPHLRPLVLVDVSASAQAAVASGLVADLLDAVAGVSAHVCGASEGVSCAVLGRRGTLLSSAVPAESPAAVRRALSETVQRSGSGLVEPMRRATAEGRGAVVVVSDAVPADLERALAVPDADPVRVVLVLMGTTRWAATATDRPDDRELWRDEAARLVPLVESGRVTVVSVPQDGPLTADRAAGVAERVSQGMIA